MFLDATPSTRFDYAKPFLDKFKKEEKEAYSIFERGCNGYTLLDEFSPEKDPQASFFSKIHYVFIGKYQQINTEIKDKQNNLLAENLALSEVAKEYCIADYLKNDLIDQLDQITLNRIHFYEHVENINALKCFTKLGWAIGSCAIVLGSITKIIYDIQTQCIEDHCNDFCPSLDNYDYWMKTSGYLLATLWGYSQIVNTLVEKNYFKFFFGNPLSDSSKKCRDLALSNLMRVSTVKERIYQYLNQKG